MCQKVGLSGDETQSLMSKIGDQEIKDKLKETTQKALDLGVGRLENVQTTGNSCLADTSFVRRGVEVLANKNY